MAEVLLYAPQGFTNVCVIARTLESFGVGACSVFDPHHLIRPRYGKSYTRRLQTVSAGAFFKVRWQAVAQPLDALAQHAGRCLAVSSSPTAVSLFGFALRADDLFVFGSEGHGIPADVTAACQAEVTIPTSGETQSLNLAVAVGIVLAEHVRQTAGTR
ncbi:MAG: TrmH family RNA methyltransferase [bacterium]